MTWSKSEMLVVAGALVNSLLKQHGATLLPVDSEHSAIFQVFDFSQPERVEKIALIAERHVTGGVSDPRLGIEQVADFEPDRGAAKPWVPGEFFRLFCSLV